MGRRGGKGARRNRTRVGVDERHANDLSSDILPQLNAEFDLTLMTAGGPLLFGAVAERGYFDEGYILLAVLVGGITLLAL